MGLAGEVEVYVELKTSADKFYKVFSNQVHHVPNASDKVHAIEVHEGDWETAGSIKVWKYTIDGETEEFKEKIDFDHEKRCITSDAVGGHILERYKKYKGIFQVTENDEGGGMVKVTLVYEKFKEGDDPPHKFLNYVADIIRDVDAHIINI
ncbi:hypothetical protein JRO89_XS05G0229900 [Xanthoceras sorbifolium]|uniref:Bet v I/Major latex protein domain-containing protein n=1 Tax=Xanthoceras sorbifolium TaxID=99658 RepID=A0ABQ8I2U6_9ROSI|nr:hypothetical protein JRO89_XS05G0229900 [Xanthoceras sorbifolium]